MKRSHPSGSQERKNKAEEQAEIKTSKLISSYFTSSLNNIGLKRQDYLNWDDYFMGIAVLSAMRSKDPVTQVGACIVNEEKIIVGIGYNGMPRGCSDDEFPWGNSGKKLDTKQFYVCHAEVNAILNKNCQDVKNCTIYVGLFPCNECAKVIIQSGIKTVMYKSDKKFNKKKTMAAKRMFDTAGVEYKQYIPKENKIKINVSDINGDQMTGDIDSD